mgnify:CR=1 FL=1
MVTLPELYPCPVVKFKSVKEYGAPQASVLIELPSQGSVQPPEALKHNLSVIVEVHDQKEAEKALTPEEKEMTAYEMKQAMVNDAEEDE